MRELPQDISTLRDDEIQSLTVEQISNFSTKHFGSITEKQRGLFTNEQESAFNNRQNALMKTKSSEDIKEMTQADIQNLSIDEISGFSPVHLKAVRAEQRAWFNSGQEDAFKAREKYFADKSAKRARVEEPVVVNKVTTYEGVKELFAEAHTTALGQILRSLTQTTKDGRKGKITYDPGTKDSAMEFSKIVVADYHRPRQEGLAPVDLTKSQLKEVNNINKYIAPSFNTLANEVKARYESMIEKLRDDMLKELQEDVRRDLTEKGYTEENIRREVAKVRVSAEEVAMTHTREIIELLQSEFKFQSLPMIHEDINKGYEEAMLKSCKLFNIKVQPDAKEASPREAAAAPRPEKRGILARLFSRGDSKSRSDNSRRDSSISDSGIRVGSESLSSVSRSSDSGVMVESDLSLSSSRASTSRSSSQSSQDSQARSSAGRGGEQHRRADSAPNLQESNKKPEHKRASSLKDMVFGKKKESDNPQHGRSGSINRFLGSKAKIEEPGQGGKGRG